MTATGVLALQGDFAEHTEALKRAGADPREVRLPADLEGLDSLIIPGGESTTIVRLIDLYGLRQPLLDFAARHPVWGTCAGLIVMSKKADLDREPLGLVDIEVHRNAFGRQVDSFEKDLHIAELGDEPFRAVFIRAPVILSAGPSVRILAEIEGQGAVAAQQGHLLVTAFHPELTRDLRLHRYFLSLGEGAAVK